MTSWKNYQFARHDWERCAAVMLDDPEEDTITVAGYTVVITPEGEKSISIKIDRNFVGASGAPEGVVNKLIQYFDKAEKSDTESVCDIIDEIFDEYEPDESEE